MTLHSKPYEPRPRSREDSAVGNFPPFFPLDSSTARQQGHVRRLQRRPKREIGDLLPNNQRQRRTCYALCHILYPVSAALTSILRMDSNSTSYEKATSYEESSRGTSAA